MRLLQHNNDGKFHLTNDLGVDAIPRYAILSHTWGPDAEEVTFEDMKNSSGENKPGYKKLQFCGEQARRDGLQHFWIDTCCINKADKYELSQAINSMYHWYRNAARCYIYLSDVSTAETDKEELELWRWESDLRKSRWFTRGWTLQELLAPGSAEFFSQKWKNLGDRVSLRQYIREITGIPDEALQGGPLTQFSIEERLSWNKDRHTKLEEDKAYSLLGIFGVYISPNYGEGAAKARERLEKEINKSNECIKDLCVTDPRKDKKRIEETKGGLLEGSCRWIFDNADFRQWQDGEHSRLLWIKGDPGKGKTMLLCGIVDELKSKARTGLLSFFFCQATDSRINSATAVLRGLLYLLAKQHPSLISYVRKEYDSTGEKLFTDTNAWIAMSDIFTNILNDAKLEKTCFIIDALDECTTGLDALLGFIAQNSSVSSRVKWIVSSRNWPSIEESLQQAGHKVKLSLELNAESVSAAVETFIKHKVSRLEKQKKYKKEIRDAVLHHLTSNANDTFLWVALVCQRLEKVLNFQVIRELKAFPPGLDSLYDRMMQQIRESPAPDVCKQILASVATVYRPITTKELATLVEQLDDDQESMQEIIGLCGSFLTLREETVYFVHQSAKDFLLRGPSEETSKGAFDEIFPSGTSDIHYDIFRASLQTMSETLQRDMYNLKELGYPANNVDKPDPDPLEASRYACSYWIDHLHESHPKSSSDHAKALQDGGPVDIFLTQKYLYWLESLGLCKEMSKGVDSMAKLEMLVQRTPNAVKLSHFVKDARRFIMYHKGVIEHSPLQAYASALLFSPTGSLVRRLFKKEEPKWAMIRPGVGDAWSACLQTLEGHSSWVWSVAFSPDSTRLASASDDKTVKIWDASSGACLQTLEGHSSRVWSVAFSPDSTRLASVSDDKTVKIWDASSGACLQTLEGYSDWIRSVAFSPDSTRLASASDDKTVKIWDASSGACLQALEIGKRLERISFDTTGSYLHTEIGAITITTLPLSQTVDNTKPQYQGAGVSTDGAWITYKGEHVLWLPSEYRPSCSIVSENSVGIGVRSGKVWICSFLS